MKYQEFLAVITDLEEKLDAAKTALTQYLNPIIDAAGLGSISRDALDYVREEREYLLVQTRFTNRANRFNSEIRIPYKLLNRKDNLATAIKFNAEVYDAQKLRERNEALEEIDRVRKRLIE